MKKLIEEERDISNYLTLSELKKEIECNRSQYDVPDEEVIIYSSSYGYDGSELCIKFNRYETDEEYSVRLDKEQKESDAKQLKLKRLAEQKQIAEQLTEAAERQQYLKLKAKYEKA